MHNAKGDSELVQIMDAALAEVAQKAGDWLVCKPGCTQCCYGAFAINALDVQRLRDGMKVLRATSPLTATAVEDRAKAWIAEHGAMFPGDVGSGLLDESDASFDEFANEAACPALDPATGRCEVYPCRPMTCRVFGPPVAVEAGEDRALAHCELCFAGVSKAEVAKCEMRVPHELEERLLDEIDERGETVVAFALLS